MPVNTPPARQGQSMKARDQRSAPDAELEQHLRAVAADPRNAQAHAMLGVALQSRERLAEAVASQRRALELDPGLTWLHPVMAAALRELGHFQEAADSYRTALAAQPNDASLQRGLSQAMFGLGRYEDASASAAQAAALAPDNVNGHLYLAACRQALDDLDGLADALRAALAIDPGLPEARMLLADTLYQLRAFAAAADEYRRVTGLNNDHFDAHCNLAAALRELKEYEAAAASYQRALDISPGSVRALQGLGAMLHVLGRVEPAVAALLRAREIDPDDALTHQYIAFAHFELGQWELALESYRRAFELGPDSALAHSSMLYALSHCTEDPHELTAEHFSFGERWEAPWRDRWQPHPNGRDPARVLRIGIVSADLYRHAVANYIEPVFALLKDNPDLSLHVYYNNTVDDEVTARLRGSVAHWQPIFGLDDDAVERQVRQDAIDILIDLNGHTPRNRLALFARKPAPVQASWIGYAGTTGLTAMDYYLSDQFMLPEGRFDDQFSEKIVRLPLGAPFLPALAAPPVSPLPALSRGYVTFGSFHRTAKLSRKVIALWARLLRAVPGSRMLLGGLSPGAGATVLGWFEEEGIEAGRLIPHERTTLLGYLALHHDVDLCLSPFPYTGATTICDALWMGVPTLATTGPTNPSHSAACYLAHLGLDAFIAPDEDRFVDLGVLLSHNLPALAELRAGMRARFAASVVGYPNIAAAGLEHALRLMWQRWCAGLPAAPLTVRLDDLLPPAIA